jgi:hypothetical protein
MRFEVPQFIEIEDKIFGPFTWRQFVYLAGGGGSAVVLYLSLPLILFVVVGIPIVALAGFLAFHQVNSRPFSVFLESFFTYMTSNKLYLWKRSVPQTITDERVVSGVASSGNSVNIPSPKTSHISSLSRKLELGALESKL